MSNNCVFSSLHELGIARRCQRCGVECAIASMKFRICLRPPVFGGHRSRKTMIGWHPPLSPVVPEKNDREFILALSGQASQPARDRKNRRLFPEQTDIVEWHFPPVHRIAEFGFVRKYSKRVSSTRGTEIWLVALPPRPSTMHCPILISESPTLLPNACTGTKANFASRSAISKMRALRRATKVKRLGYAESARPGISTSARLLTPCTKLCNNLVSAERW